MENKDLPLCFVFLYLCMCTGVLSQVATLAPKGGAVIENDSITLICSYNGTTQVNGSRWKYSAASTNPAILWRDNSCVAAGFLDNSVQYVWTCYRNNSFSLKIKKVELRNHGETWSCRMETSESNIVTISVMVPVSRVEITIPAANKITVSENSNTKFVCNSSTARPVSRIEWFISKTLASTNHVHISNNTKNSSSYYDEDYSTTTGSLIFEPNRTYNNWFLFCIAKNVNNRKVESSRIHLNITYAPDGPPIIEGLQNKTKYYVIENKGVKFVCISQGGNPRANLAWNCMNKTPTTFTNETTVKSEITWTASKSYSGQCICKSNHVETTQITVAVNVEVLYPPSNPVILKNNNRISQPNISTVYIIINNSLSLYCKSSSNPKPFISWKLPNGKGTPGPTLNLTHIDTNNTGKYICNATNEMHASNGEVKSGSAISNVVLKLLYPPTNPQFRYGEISGLEIGNMTLVVIIGDNVRVACASSGQPEPSYMWTWSNGQSIGQILTVNSALRDLVATCIATNVMNETSGESRVGKSEARLSINVLYPPKLPMITLQTDRDNDYNILDNVKVIENTPFKLKCETVSKPTPSYSWYGPITTTSSVLSLSGISREQGGSYRCLSYNEMVRTFGSREKGENSTSIHLHVLYPPEISSLQDKTAIERSSINITCPVVIGNPSKLLVIWKRSTDGKTWKGHHLVINQVFRSDSATYTCAVNNTMVPTTGEVVYGKNNRSFDLEVLYNASVLDFFAKGHYDTNPVIVDENTFVELTCNIASNPKPNAAIYYMENILKQKNETLSLSFMQKSASCEHSGVYKCTGDNEYNYGKPSEKFLTLHVRCFPRPSPYVKIQEKYFVNEHDRLTISFSVLAYPVPQNDDFKWRKQDVYGWKTLTTSDDIIINTVELLSNLTIVDVRETDFGTYRLEVDNSIGIFEQEFFVGPKETPALPNDFISLQPFATANTVTVQWKPGVDGGYPQTFHLKYRIISEKTWTDISIPHAGEDMMSYTLTNLTRDAEYEIKIYSVNKLGQSANFVTLRIRTKGTTDTTGIPLLYIIIAGSLAGLVVLIAVVVCLIIRRRRVVKQRQRENLVRYENGDALKQNDYKLDGRKSVNGQYDEIGPEVLKREAYEKLTTDKKIESLHAYQVVDLFANDGTEQYQNVSQFKKGQGNNEGITEYQNTSQINIGNDDHINEEQESSTSQIKIGKAGQVVRFCKGPTAEGKKKVTITHTVTATLLTDDANNHRDECTSNDETVSPGEQYQNLMLKKC